MVTDYVYKYLSDEIYKIENDKQNYAENKEIFDSGGNNIAKRNKYKILALEDNQNNGMQAMVVAPVNDRGEVDTRRIVIAKDRTRISNNRWSWEFYFF